MPCQANRGRPTYRDKGWICTGENLITVLWATALEATGALTPLRRPVVAPAGVEKELRESSYASAYTIEPFRGTDHMHLVLTDDEVPADHPARR